MCVCGCCPAGMRGLYPASASDMPRGLLVLLGRDGESGRRRAIGRVHATPKMMLFALKLRLHAACQFRRPGQWYEPRAPNSTPRGISDAKPEQHDGFLRSRCEAHKCGLPLSLVARYRRHRRRHP